MYARITHIAAYPWRIDEMLDRLEEVRGQIAQIPGLRYWFTTSDRESGVWVLPSSTARGTPMRRLRLIKSWLRVLASFS